MSSYPIPTFPLRTGFGEGFGDDTIFVTDFLEFRETSCDGNWLPCYILPDTVDMGVGVDNGERLVIVYRVESRCTGTGAKTGITFSYAIRLVGFWYNACWLNLVTCWTNRFVSH